ncbi:hypothetical protein TRVL_02013 [Trypanosoma vivax]|nr:hypothetical protein TRVL_02013 [Trypanosoma vivax]
MSCCVLRALVHFSIIFHEQLTALQALCGAACDACFYISPTGLCVPSAFCACFTLLALRRWWLTSHKACCAFLFFLLRILPCLSSSPRRCAAVQFFFLVFYSLVLFCLFILSGLWPCICFVSRHLAASFAFCPAVLFTFSPQCCTISMCCPVDLALLCTCSPHCLRLIFCVRVCAASVVLCVCARSSVVFFVLCLCDSFLCLLRVRCAVSRVVFSSILSKV